MNSQDEYVPFGTEWEKEMHRFTKAELIGLLREQFIKNAPQPNNTLDDNPMAFSCCGGIDAHRVNCNRR